jgi:hypothetical protein
MAKGKYDYGNPDVPEMRLMHSETMHTREIAPEN